MINQWLFPLFLIVHVLGATIWTGGHLILTLGYLPMALKQKNPEIIYQFEEKFEPIGLIALGIQIITGLWLANFYIPLGENWLNYNEPMTRNILVKLCLLLITLILSIDARFRIIPNLNQENFLDLVFHILAVTIIAISLIIFGITIRFGGL
ncbi:CopD family protein [Geminocystis sp. GBBB08]|uniref:CopD family protein n=1 Tax=Geminocystis sp. GBBB08 TaxID=2604140 RepID=UPI0027E390EF|nr:CopD family protein [Geminocystis sp. GBBB08]MBL1210917.1 copper resistance protein CopD [Geminocystis sp. GBBB08]